MEYGSGKLPFKIQTSIPHLFYNIRKIILIKIIEQDFGFTVIATNELYVVVLI